MDKITFTAADGTTTDYFPQSYTDAAVATAVAALPVSGPTVVQPTDTEIDVMVSDGTMKKFVPAA